MIENILLTAISVAVLHLSVRGADPPGGVLAMPAWMTGHAIGTGRSIASSCCSPPSRWAPTCIGSSRASAPSCIRCLRPVGSRASTG